MWSGSYFLNFTVSYRTTVAYDETSASTSSQQEVFSGSWNVSNFVLLLGIGCRLSRTFPGHLKNPLTMNFHEDIIHGSFCAMIFLMLVEFFATSPVNCTVTPSP